MADLIQKIEDWHGNLVIAGVGSADNGDDAIGLYVAKRLSEEIHSKSIKVVICDSESKLFRVADCCDNDSKSSFEDEPDHVIFIDAVEFGGKAGSIVLLNSNEIKERFPQVSTHKISLSTIANIIESNGKTRVWLIGIQPQMLTHSSGLSDEVKRSADVLIGVLSQKFRLNGKAILNMEAQSYVQS